MDFRLSEEQEIVRRTVREFAEGVIGQRVRELDEKQEFPRDIMKQLGEMGFLGVLIPPEYGGAGMSTHDYALIIERHDHSADGTGGTS